MQRPKNIVVLVADSLRYDSVYETGIGLPYAEKHGVQFTEARSGGCWTLPGTASLFTGLLPHEHGATEQTRGIHGHVPTLAEQMQIAGYKTYQITANIATTEIFGLDRGFDEVHRIWKHVDPKFNALQKFLVLIGKPRLREKLMSRDMLMNKMSADIDMSKTWLQSTHEDVFNMARRILAQNESKGQGSFLFLNLMETHFPYHVAPTFQLTGDGLLDKVREVVSLFHFVNQTFLVRGEQNISRRQLDVLKDRQRAAWRSMASVVDGFLRELHENTGNLVVFLADHGENFGESGWTYHFSNVTDAGNKVPLFYLDHEPRPAGTVSTPIGTRHLYDTILKAAGRPTKGPDLFDGAGRAWPVMSSYWYNNRGKTHPSFLYNQMAFLSRPNRFMLRNNEWYQAPFETDYDEPQYQKLPAGVDPVEEMVFDAEQKKYYRQVVSDFRAFSSKIKFYS